MKRLCHYIAEYMGVLVLTVAAVSLLRPDSFAWIDTWAINPMLGLIMFGMGLTLSPSDFRVVLSRPRVILIGCLAQFTVMPLLALGLTWAFSLPRELALGVILVGCCPGGTASNVITYLARGDLALSVGMTATSTLLAPVLTPLLVWLLAGTMVEVDTVGMLRSIVYVVIAPIAAGLLCQRFVPKLTSALVPYLPAFSSMVIALVVGIIVSHNADRLLTGGLLVVLVVVLHNICGLGLGYLAGRLAGLSEAKKRAISIEVGMQNSGLASSLATLHFAAYPFATIPGAIFSVWHNISGAIVARIYARGAAAAMIICSVAMFSCSQRSAEFCPQAPNYADTTMWIAEDRDSVGTGADVFYVVSTWEKDWRTADSMVCHYADVWNPQHRERIAIEMNRVAEYMAPGNRFYAPYYRHTTIEAFETMNEDTIRQRTRLAMSDVCAAFDHFQQQRDTTRPLIIAGFSQGGLAVVELLKHISDETYTQLAAAYVLGYKVTPEDTAQCRRIRPAQGESDTGVTICYNTVKDVKYAKPVIAATCFAINPVNWRTDATPATLHDTITVTLSTEHHVLVVSGYSGAEYKPYKDLLNVGDIHSCEPWLYSECLRQNIAVRTKAWRESQYTKPIR